METKTNKFSKIFQTCHSLGGTATLKLIRDTLFSANQYYLLGRSLASTPATPFTRAPKEKISLITESDLIVLRKKISTLGEDDRREILARLYFYDNGFANCYVIKNDGEIAYLQWIIFPSENSIINKKYANRFNQLSDRQVMIENAFTFPAYRGRGYLPCGTQQLLELAKRNHYTSAVCYIRTDRITSVNEFTKMGFKIIRILDEYKFLGKVWRTKIS
jgi:hypothetical protein